MLRRRLGMMLATLAPLAGGAGAVANVHAQLPASTRCAVGIPSSETTGYVPLPRGDVFCPLLADPKGQRSFVSYLHETSDDGDMDLGSVGISEEFGLFRVNGSKPGTGFQMSLNGSVFAQFDLDVSSYDLLNADYTIGIPMTFRVGAFSTRLRLYHQSSHLGDELLLREDNPDWFVGIRQDGLVIGLEFEHPQGAMIVSRHLYEHGVWAIFSTLDPRVLQFKPGLLLTPDLAEELLDRVAVAVASARTDSGARGAA